MSWVYPRVCGGTALLLGGAFIAMGLSPRVRGNLQQVRPGRSWARSIPACAGEPLDMNTAASAHRVYPRVCGGTMDEEFRTAWKTGLSPRVRGNLSGRRGLADQPGSIPACAGEPLSKISFRFRNRVYPRVCGGTFKGLEDVLGATGLSPRVRGNPRWRV